MFYKLNYKIRQWRFLKSSIRTPLQPLYEQALVQPSQAFKNTRLLVVDCEMSGLNATSCQLLSIGWVVIEHSRILSASGRHVLIHADRGVGESSKIHGMLDSHLAGAQSAAAALMLLIQHIQGAVVVFHHAGLDLRFLQKASIENFRCPLLFPYIDTLEIEKLRLRAQGKTAGLRLSQCRARYGLPPVGQHNALADAQATAELLLAQASYAGPGPELKLSQLGLRS